MKRHVLMLAGLTALSALAACGDGAYQLTSTEVSVAQNGARDFADRAGGKFLSCSGQDSNGDSYVTCSVTSSAGAEEELLCSYKSQGCKRK